VKRRFGQAWTEEDDETIRKMAEANSSAFLIAARLRRSIASIQRRAPTLGVKIRSERQRKADVSKASMPQPGGHG
jgi:hypothetical protein